MRNYIQSGSKSSRIQSIGKEKHMKLTIKQRLRNWLNSDEPELAVQDCVATAQLESHGMRLQIYRASGGFVVETCSYDRRNDRNNNSMHVITEDQDLGEALSKIVMMEALK